MRNKRTKKDKGKSKHGLISDPSFDEIIQLPTKFRKDELPLKRESRELKSKKNCNNSRKSSVGKIIGQAVEYK